MDFVDNRIDTFTGTMRGRGLLPNPDHMLTPGLFAKVRLPGSGRYRASLIPDRAIIRDQTRPYVYVVDEEGMARRRDIELGRVVAGLRVVLSGIEPEDLVVIQGTQAIPEGVEDGAEVIPEEVPITVDEEAWAREMPIDEFFPTSEEAVGFASGRRIAS